MTLKPRGTLLDVQQSPRAPSQGRKAVSKQKHGLDGEKLVNFATANEKDIVVDF